MSLFSTFLFSENLNYSPKIKILTNVKTSTLQENIKIDDDVFVRIKTCVLNGVFGFGSIGFVFICYCTISNKIAFLFCFFDPFKCIIA